jgi:hypothetical protein
MFKTDLPRVVKTLILETKFFFVFTFAAFMSLTDFSMPKMVFTAFLLCRAYSLIAFKTPHCLRPTLKNLSVFSLVIFAISVLFHLSTYGFIIDEESQTI